MIITFCVILILAVIFIATAISESEGEESGCGVWLLAIVFIIFCIAEIVVHL